MKKNVMMRVAALLLVCVMATTCGISGTFAKYVTADSGMDIARVAKFGVNIDIQDSIFATDYAFDADKGTLTGIYSVSSDLTAPEKVVAPGTAGSLAAMEITGTPEVAVRVTYAAEVTFSGWAVPGDDFYCPLVLTINGHDYYLEGYASAAEAKAAIEAIVAAYSVEFEAKSVLDDQDLTELTVSWSWPFYTSDANDVKDTALGDQAAALNFSTIQIKITCTVTQID